MSDSVFITYLEKFGRYPDARDTEDLSLGHVPSSRLVKSKLVSLNQNLFIDVTHTVHYPYNSGIQRVVRTLVTAMKKNGASFELIKFNLDGQPVLLTPHEIDKFYNWERHIDTAPMSVNVIDTLARSLAPILKALIPLPAWNFAKRVYFNFKASLVSKDPILPNGALLPVVDLRNKQLLLPEVVTEQERVNAVCVLSKHYNVSISAVLYDLIPVTHPEYCTVGYDFIHYLRIFRSIKTVFSISRHSEIELTKIMSFLPREIPAQLQIKTLYLGGDFEPISKTLATPISADKKVILMVARFEPRKNIRRVLVAVEKLFKDSTKFKFVLVGNPGWLQEHILEDLERLKSTGYDVEYHMRVSDAELIAWYQKSYFTVFCSITEGFGLPIIESVLLGKPCVTTHSGSQAEIASLIGGCELVDPFDSNDIYLKMKKLLTNEAHYKIKEGETRAAQWPSWSDYAKQVYTSITFDRT